MLFGFCTLLIYVDWVKKTRFPILTLSHRRFIKHENAQISPFQIPKENKILQATKNIFLINGWP